MREGSHVLRPARVGILGLGDQGTPIALRLIEAGWPLAFHARKPGTIERFRALGATFYDPIELGAVSDILLVVVGNWTEVSSAVVASGMLNAMRPGSILAVHSSIPPDAIHDLAGKAEARRVHCLDAPVSGGRARSYAGDLTILVGGDEAVVHAARPVFDVYGSSVVRTGDAGSAQLMKALNNYFYAAHLATAAKTVELIRSFGIDPALASRILPICSGSSTAFALQAAREFAVTQHDGGDSRAASLLAEVVETLRSAAADAGTDLGLVDRLVDEGLATLSAD